MFIISDNNEIDMVQGDTGVINLNLANYHLSNGDRVRFALTTKKMNSTTNIYTGSKPLLIVEKLITSFESDGTARIVLYPKDTLELAPGKYFYEIQITTKTGVVDTIIQATKFTILEGMIYEWE